MKQLDAKWRNKVGITPQDEEEIARFYDELKEKTKAIANAKFSSDGKEDFAIHRIDREMFEIYSEKIGRGIFGDDNRNIEPSFPYAEIVLQTVENVFSEGYLTRNYASPDYPDEKDGDYHHNIKGKQTLEDALQTIRKLKKKIGAYEAKMYGINPQEIEETFKKIILHICTEDIEKHAVEIESDINITEKNFVGFVVSTVNTVEQATQGRIIRFPYLPFARETKSIYDEEYISKQFHDDALTRTRAERFLIDLQLLKTIVKRYREYRFPQT